MRILRRLVFLREESNELINPLVYIFMISGFSFALGFSLFSNSEEVSQTILFMAMKELNFGLARAWGLFGLVAMAMLSVNIFLRSVRVSKAAATVGFMWWLFAGFMYILSSSWMGLFGIGLPNLLFWVWLYFETLKYENEPDIAILK